MAELLTTDEEVFTPIDEMEVSQPVEEPQEQEDDVPEKFRGKSPKDLIKMYQESEKLIGKQGNEVGELRRIVDDFIKSQVVSKDKAEEQEEVDYYADPEKAVKKAIDSHPAVRQAQEAAVAMRRAETIAKLESKFGDITQIAEDSGFQEWVKGSKVRMQLLAQAETQFDYDAADELLSNWTERTKAAKEVSKQVKEERNSQLKAADAGSKGNTEGTSKKIYRRSDIIELMQKNPSRYHALQDEILKAYSEGRVR